MNLDLTELPKETDSLKRIISSQQHEVEHLQEMVRLFQNELFGRKSEVLPSAHPDQLQLFTPPEPAEPIQADETIEIKGHNRKNAAANRCRRIFPGLRSSTTSLKKRNAAPAGPS